MTSWRGGSEMININEMENWLQENNMFPVRGRANGKFNMWERSILQWLNNNQDKEIRSAVIAGKLRYIIVKKEK